MAFGRFRSFRNPVTKKGATSNTTGSRIRSSARTLREKSASLVQQARSKVSSSSPVKGYQHATAARKVAGSAAAAGEIARKRAFHKTTDDAARRQAAYQGIKKSPAPAGSSLGYRAGYRVGAQVAAGKYKSNVALQHSKPYQPTHMQPKGFIQTKPTGLENAFERGLSAVQKGSRAAAITANRGIGRATRRVQDLKSTAKQGFNFGKGPHVPKDIGVISGTRETYQLNRMLGAKRSDATAIAGGFAAGNSIARAQDVASRVRAGGRAAVGQVRAGASSLARGVKSNVASAKSQAGDLYQRTKLKARSKVLTAKQSASSLYNSAKREFAVIRSSVGYGLRSGTRMPEASVKQAYEAQRGFNSKAGSGAFAAAYGAGKAANRVGSAAANGSSAIRSAAVRAPQAAGNAIINTVESAGRFVAPAARKLGEANLKMWEAPIKAARAAYREVYTAPRQSYAKKMFDARNAQVHAEYAAEIRGAKDRIRYTNNARRVNSTNIGNMAGQTTRWGNRGGVTPTGRNAVAQQVRYQNYMDRRAASRSTNKATASSINTSKNLQKFNSNLVAQARANTQKSAVSSTTATPTQSAAQTQQNMPFAQPQAQVLSDRQKRAQALLGKRKAAQEIRARQSGSATTPIDQVRNDTMFLKQYSATIADIRAGNKKNYKYGSNSNSNSNSSSRSTPPTDPGLKSYWEDFVKDARHKRDSAEKAKGAKAAYTASTATAGPAKRQPKKPFTNPVASKVMSSLGAYSTPEQVMAHTRKPPVLKTPEGIKFSGRKPVPGTKAWNERVLTIADFLRQRSRAKRQKA